MATVLMLNPTVAFAQEAPDPFACYGIADERNGALDGLAIISRLDGSAQVIGDDTGTLGIEAMAFVPQDVGGTIQQVLMATADPSNNGDTSNTLGIVDITTGLWAAIAGPIGSGTDANGTSFDFTANGDIDGLTYDVQREILWATQRNGGDGNPDYLLQLDPATGQIVPGAFGAGVDWVAVPVATDPAFVTPAGLPYDDVDDLAVDPETGRIFIINNKGGTGGGLVELNPDGSVLNYIGLFTSVPAGDDNPSSDEIIDDMEGLAFFNDGQLYGSTGNNGPEDNDKNEFYEINVNDGTATWLGDFPDETKDIEALGCLTAPAFITLEKATNGEDADTPTGPTVTAGDPVTWTYVIENTGAVELLDMTLNDDIEGDVSGRCEEGPLPNPFAPGDTFTCTVVGIATEGQYANVGTVDAIYLAPGPAGDIEVPLSATDPSHYIGDPAPIILVPDISIVKTAGDAADGEVYTIEAPGLVTFTYVVENTGQTHLTDITITDDLGTADTADDVLLTDAECTGLAGPLAPDGTVTCTAQIQVNGTVTNVATTTGTPTDEGGTPVPDVESPTDNDPAEVVYSPPTPGISIVKTAGDAADGEVHTIQAPGLVIFTYVVENTGGTYLTDITITDDLGTADTADDVLLTDAECTGLAGPLAPGGTVTCTAEIQVNGTVTNVATTTGTPTDPAGNPLPGVDSPTDNDPADVVYDPPTPGISIVKTAGDAADGDVYTIEAPGLVLFTYVVENTGGTYLTDITITDDLGTADTADDVLLTDAECTGLAGPLAPSGTVTCTAEIQVNGTVTNVATTTGTPTDPAGNPLPGVESPTDNDPADVDYAPPTPGISIVKTAGDAADGEVYPIAVAGLVTFTYVVENTGGTYLTDITITDNAGTADTADDVLITSAECAGLAGPLAPGGTVTCTAQIQVTVDTTNVADTTGTPTDPAGNPLPGVTQPTDNDDAVVDFVGIPGISIVKTAGDAADGGTLPIDVAGLVTFNYEVTNTGTTNLIDIVVNDDAGTPDDDSDDVTIDSSTCPELVGPLAPGGVVNCTADIEVTADTTNIADTIGTPADETGAPLPDLTQPTDSDPAVVDFVGIPGISIVKTAGDAADGGTLPLDVAGLVTFNYEVTNSGTTNLIDIVVNDDAGTPDDDSDDVTIDSSTCAELAGPVAPGGVVNCTADIEVAVDTTNVADTTGTPADENGNPLPDLAKPTDRDDAVVDFIGVPGIALEKSVYLGHDGGASCPGGDLSESIAGADVTFCFEVTNTGTTYQNNVTVSDPTLDIELTSPDLLAPGATVMLYHETSLDAPVVNTAEVAGVPSDENGNPIPGLENPPATDIAEVSPFAQIGNIVWLDENANGVLDDGEQGLAGVAVTLYDENDNPVPSYVVDADGNLTTDAEGNFVVANAITTDENGIYNFIVPPGTYSLGFDIETTLGEGYYISPQDVAEAANDDLDSDANEENGRTITTQLVAGESDFTWDTGIYAPPVMQVTKSHEDTTLQPGGTIKYTILYSNTGTSDAEGVIITETIPQYTTFAPDQSSPGWKCENDAITAGTLCEYEVGTVAKGTLGDIELSFTIVIDRFIPEEVEIISNEITINDNGNRVPDPVATEIVVVETPFTRPLALETTIEDVQKSQLQSFLPMMFIE